jgi:hypothetical protein
MREQHPATTSYYAHRSDTFSPTATITLAVFLLIAIGIAAYGQRSRGFETCEQARQVGVVLPLTPADPGWNPALDVDRDGQAC